MSKQNSVVEGWKRDTIERVTKGGALFFSEVCYQLGIPEATENEFFEKAFKPLIDEGKIVPFEEYPVSDDLHPINSHTYRVVKTIAPEAPVVEQREALE